MSRGREVQTALCSPSERVVSPVVAAVFYAPVTILLLGIFSRQLAVVGLGLMVVAETQRQCPKLLCGHFAAAVDEWLLQRAFVWRMAGKTTERRHSLEQWRKRITAAIVPLDIFLVYAVTEWWLHPVQAPPVAAPAYLIWLISLALLAAPVGTLWIVATSLEIRYLRQPPRSLHSVPLVLSRELGIRLETETARWVALALETAGACCIAISALS
ncbi:MAG: hypothetical protein QOE44_82 [Solirubrobacteraceae bacterium]|jgi:hypothetical protein|nr:hypothetical protein [Solirubrobacteraceae bacterium]